jgi:hypothetical protein
VAGNLCKLPGCELQVATGAADSARSGALYLGVLSSVPTPSASMASDLQAFRDYSSPDVIRSLAAVSPVPFGPFDDSSNP